MVERIVAPLIENACRHAEADAAVTVSRDGSSVLITVSDDGPGIDPQELEHIFQPGARGSGALGTAAPGSASLSRGGWHVPPEEKSLPGPVPAEASRPAFRRLEPSSVNSFHVRQGGPVMSKNRLTVIALVVVGVLLIVARDRVFRRAGEESCQARFPGHEAGPSHHHIKHGVAALLARDRALRWPGFRPARNISGAKRLTRPP